MIQRALISVSDKQGVVEFVRALAAHRIEILSTGGTAKLLRDSGIAVVEVSEYTGFPEMLDGRVKTLHPRVHGGILGRRDLAAHAEAMRRHDIPPIDLVVVNLYPFEQATTKPGCTLEEAIENIDIGGPALLRAAAKNHGAVTVLVDSRDYGAVLEELAAGGAVSPATRFRLAVKAFEHTARYDGLIADYLGRIEPDGNRTAFPRTLNLQFERAGALRYGENPHQPAAFYVEPRPAEPCVASARVLQGRELSFNNIADADAALECVKQFGEAPACVIVKHANPCGVALGASIRQAYELAYATDPESAFGGIIAFNRELDEETAKLIVERQFVEVIIAPGVSAAAAAAVAAKKNVRLLTCDPWPAEPARRLDFRRVTGGLLVQEADLALHASLKTVTAREPTAQELEDLRFVWRVAKFVKSNAIVYGRDRRTIGIGAGQMSRVNSARIAVIKAEQAGLPVRGAVMASDAFFPFRDGLDQAAAAGVTAVIQPGGSMRDAEVIAAANEHGIAMVFTGMRHFRH